MGEVLVKEEERPFVAAAFSRFVRVSLDRSEDLLSGGESEVVAPRAPTLFVADRHARIAVLPPEKFEAYLREEGLDAIVTDRRGRGESNRPGRERYTRHLKLFVGAPIGSASGAISKRKFGQRLEITLTNSDLGKRLEATVTFDGTPLEGASVAAFVRRNGSVNVQTRRTNERGNVIFEAATGFWNFRLVHMQRCYGCVDADWESFWASFVVEFR